LVHAKVDQVVTELRVDDSSHCGTYGLLVEHGLSLRGVGRLARVDRLSLFKLLADRSRYSIYQELAGSPEPLSTTDISSRLNLHPNTVRLHLEKMRDAGLVEGAPDRHGMVGRPQHRWRSIDPAAPLGLEPAAPLGLEHAGFRLLAQLLAELAADSQLKPGTAAAVGRRHIADRSITSSAGASGLEALISEFAQLGFDPAVEPGRPSSADGSGIAGISFTSCPFRELAVRYPDVVCELHRGIAEGLCGQRPVSGEVVSFSSLVDQDPCRVEVSFKAG